jgi:hypothetical protein
VELSIGGAYAGLACLGLEPISCVPIEIDATLEFYGVFTEEPSRSLIVVSGAVV